MREGRSASDISTILQLNHEKLARYEMKSAINVASFFVKWKHVLEEIHSERLSEDEEIILGMFIRNY